MKSVTILAIILLVSPALFAAVTVNFENGETLSTQKVATYTTLGTDLEGILVTVVYSDSSLASETVEWSGNGAYGTTWSLTLDGDSYVDPWTLTVSDQGIASITINAVAGNAMFDVVGQLSLTNRPYKDNGTQVSLATHTPNSEWGNCFGDNDSVTLSGASVTLNGITATYSDRIALDEDPDDDTEGRIYGDLYGELTIAFDTSFTGTMTFISDMDEAEYEDLNPGDDDDDIIPGDDDDDDDDTTTVPVPGALLLATLGTMGTGFIRRRRRLS